MKNLKHILAAVILMACTTNTFAVDRIVEENGFGGAFTTIQAAINAAASNDRIIIYPRAGGAAYVENPSYLSQTGVQMLSAIETTRYKITGSVNIFTGWQVIGAEVTGTIQFNGTGASIDRIINCVVNGTTAFQYALFANNPSSIMHIDNCTISSGTAGSQGSVSFFRGRVTGCTINMISNGGFGILENSFNSSDTSIIAGNTINMSSGSTTGIYVPNGALTQQYIHINNNYIRGTSGQNMTGIRIEGIRPAAGSARSMIHNNTISFITGFAHTSGIYIGGGAPGAGNLDVRNNIVNNPGQIFGPGAYFRVPSSNIGLTFQYNHVIASSNQFALNGVTPDVTNISPSVNNLNNTTGALISGPAINGGDPAASYLDLDLTTNDAGCFGGSMSMANFNTVDNGSRVLYMNLPRTMFINQTLNIKADGVDK